LTIESTNLITTFPTQEKELYMLENKERILIVDDDTSILKFMKAILEKNHYYVETAETAEEALSKCKNDQYDIALLDIKLPDMEGTELLRRLRDTQMVKIMVTGFPSQRNSIESLNLGAHAYLIKPIKPNDLLTIVQENLERQKNALNQNQDLAIGLLGQFINYMKDKKGWIKINDIAYNLHTSKYSIEKITNFCESLGLIRLKYWKNKGLIELTK
jgi:DNA-binding response OmpR family regulator